MLNKKYYSDQVLQTLRARLRKSRRNPGRRPLFIFSCGGEENNLYSPHPARGDLRNYIERSSIPSLDNVICLNAETVATNKVFEEFDLLTQEAIIADVADWLIIFAESAGSFCELGAFASLPHVQSITSVAVDRRYKGDHSFLLDGPVETIRMLETPLAQVFYLDLQCPLASTEFTGFVNEIREGVRESEKYQANKGRKNLIRDTSDLFIGPLVHELLDLVFIASPILESDLIDLYRTVRDFDTQRLRIRSRVLAEDMNKGDKVMLSMPQVISFMVASGMIDSVDDRASGERMLSSAVMLHDYFMFRSDQHGELSDVRKQMALDKRRDGIGGGFYSGLSL